MYIICMFFINFNVYDEDFFDCFMRGYKKIPAGVNQHQKKSPASKPAGEWFDPLQSGRN